MTSITEGDVLRLLLARRDNYQVSHLAHLRGRLYQVQMNDEPYTAVVLVSSFQFYERRYHLARRVPSLVVCYEHTTVLPVPVLSLRVGNFARPYELPEAIADVAAQRKSKTGSQVLLGMYLCGMKSAVTLVTSGVPPTTRRRYLERAQALSKRARGKPVSVGQDKPQAKPKGA
jgi:hypothetical protein